MTQRLFAFAVIIVLALLALSASEHRPVNANLPIVNEEASQ